LDADARRTSSGTTAQPIVVLVGEPHSGQRMVDRKPCAAPSVDGGALADEAFSPDTGTRLNDRTSVPGIGAKLVTMSTPNASTTKDLPGPRSRRPGYRTDESRDRGLRRAGADRRPTGWPRGCSSWPARRNSSPRSRPARRAISDSFVYGCRPRPAGGRALLLDVLAQEAAPVLTPVARARLIDYSGACHAPGVGHRCRRGGVRDGARDPVGVSARLDGLRQQAVGRPAGRRRTRTAEGRGTGADHGDLIAELDAMIASTR